MLNFCFLTLKYYINIRGIALLDVLCLKIGSGALAVERWKNPKKNKSRVNIFDAQFRGYREKKPLKGSWTNFTRGEPDHVCNFWWWSVKGFGRGKVSNFPFLHWLASSPLQHTRTTVRVCDIHRRISEKDDPSRHAFQGHSRLSEPTRIDPPPMTSYKRSTATTDQFRTVS